MAEAEAEEIDQIIARVEELERVEAEGQEERRREEAELARLEEQRLRQEEARRRDEERMAQELRQTLRLSVDDACQAIQSAWNGLLPAQKKSLDDRHSHAEQQHVQIRDEAIRRQGQENGDNLAKMESNIAKRTHAISERHNAEQGVFALAQQELEDDMFLEIQLHLRGKQDKEARERRLQERFQRQREERQEKMRSRHRSEFQALQANMTMELQGLKLTSESKLARLEYKFRAEFGALCGNVAADRAWFDFLAERRQNMVDANRRLMLEALDADQEPVGLTEEAARAIGPFLTSTQLDARRRIDSGLCPDSVLLQEPRQEPWREVLVPSPASSASPARSFVDLAVTSQQLLNSLDPPATTPGPDGETSQTGAATHLMSNSAFAWMTGADEDNPASGSHSVTAQHSPPTRSHGLRRQTRSRAAPMTSRYTATANPADMVMSGALRQRKYSASPRGHLEVPFTILAPLQTGRHRLSPSSEGLQSAERYVEDAPPPVPEVPSIFLAQQPGSEEEKIEHKSFTVPQPRGLGGLVPVDTPARDSHRATSSYRTHTRQESSSSSSSSSSLLLTPSTAPTSRPPSATRTTSSRSNGDSLFLHSLITATTNAATAAGRPSTTSLSPVSPTSPAAEATKLKSEPAPGRQMRLTRSVWSILG
ncbi:hypothetical protein AYL99_07593 [Fonsecaea erecta]|uniref:Uncharacterized protein n=1 Tax=Fonsecaea erecta TaxID=1367422 RepID=A0A178ZH43_9EURO|nr:hypothetical protein AYL99_07593 [Fonsecaea erecta]OAP58503.1 hypothetical protein AYL99_07593 [Fonsecaea erecta]